MTPEERQLIADLFERLAALENEPRDPAAEQVIRAGLQQAPHAIYPLVQSVLVQDEALKAADARIQELEAALSGGRPPERRGFLDNMRDSVFGREEPRGGSVPSVRPGEQPMGVPPGYRADAAPWGGGSPQGGAQWGGGAGPQGGPQWGGQPQPQQYDAPPQQGRGGGFLGSAAAAAAGAIGGGILMNSIGRMLGGGQHRGPTAGAMDEAGSGGSRTPWGGGERGGGGGDLSREAGLNDIGGRSRTGLFGDDQGSHDQGSHDQGGYDRTAGLYDTDTGEGDEGEYDDDTGFGGDYDDSDTA